MDKRTKGFTLLEMMIVFGIIAVLGLVAGLNLFGTKGGATLTDTTQSIATVLRQAQSDSMAQENSSQWGVHFDNTTSTSPFYALFYSSNGTYASSVISSRYLLPAGICFTTSSVPAGSSTDVVFSSLSGAPNSSGTIGLEFVTGGGCASATTSATAAGVSRNSAGEIFFDNFNRTNL
jgi:prepilin-type N-terminal cleavage/methylation domain-containing protein